MKSFDQIYLEYGVRNVNGVDHLFRAVSNFAAEAWMKGDAEFSQCTGSSFVAVTDDDCKEWNIGRRNIRRLTNEQEFLNLLENGCFLFKKYVSSDLADEGPLVDYHCWSMENKLSDMFGTKKRPLFTTVSAIVRNKQTSDKYVGCSWYKKRIGDDSEELGNKEWFTVNTVEEMEVSLRHLLQEHHSEFIDEQLEMVLKSLTTKEFGVFTL